MIKWIAIFAAVFTSVSSPAHTETRAQNYVVERMWATNPAFMEGIGLTKDSSHEEALMKFSLQVGQLIQLASDEVVVRYGLHFSDTAKTIGKGDAEQCYRFLAPSIYGLMEPSRVERFDFTAMNQATYSLLEASSGGKRRQINEDAAQDSLIVVLDKLSQKYDSPQELVGQFLSGEARDEEACFFWADVYGMLAELEDSAAANVIRWLNS